MAKRRRYGYARRKSGSKRGVVRGTAAAMVLAAVIYFAVAGGLGTWLADNLIVPFMGGENPANTQGDAATTPGPAGSTGETATPPPATQMPAVTRDLTLNPIPFYAIQLGAFISEDNAENEANSIRKRGAAGYIFRDSDRHRVLASAYLTRADADKVRVQLLEQQGLESYVLDMYAQGGAITLRVTASEERINAMEEAMEALRGSLNDIEDIARRLDMQQIGPELARTECREVANGIIANSEALTGGVVVDGASDTIESFNGILEAQAADLLNISDNSQYSAMEISSQIKYIYINTLDSYGALLRTISQA